MHSASSRRLPAILCTVAQSSLLTAYQAVALNLASDRAELTNVRLLGNQDTFLLKDSARAYIRNSYIAGDSDFVFGGGIAVFDSSEIHTLPRGGSV